MNAVFGISDEVMKTLTESWSDKSIKQYNTYLKCWFQFCHNKKCDPGPDVPVPIILDFLNYLHKRKDLSYSAINSARSALSAVLLPKDGYEIGKHPLVCRLMKAVFRAKPSLPKYNKVWDIGLLVSYLRQYGCVDSLDRKSLSVKLLALLQISTAGRLSTLHSIKISDLHWDNGCLIIQISNLLKTSRPSFHQSPYRFDCYTENILCVNCHVRQYLVDTAGVENRSEYLFLTYQAPYSRASLDTLRRWMKDILRKAGVPLGYGAHSVRTASVSAAFSRGLEVETILKTGGWSSEKTFQKHYNREIRSENQPFVHKVLL